MFVYFTDASGNSVLLNNTQYSISGIGNANGGTVTYPLSGSPIATGTSLTMIRILAYQQLTDLINQGGYYPDVVEAALDYLTMLTQQLTEAQNRALSLAVETDGSISVILPVPQANYLIAWNSGGNGLTNISPNTLSGLVSYGTWASMTFNGDGVTTDFTLTSDPLVAANIDAAVGSAVQRAGIDYIYLGSNTVRFASPPPVGTNNVYMRWGSVLPVGSASGVANPTAAGLVDFISAQSISGVKTFTTSPKVPTASASDSSLNAASTAFVQQNARQKLQSVSASVASNALTVGLNPTLLDFRSSTLSNGVPNTRNVAAAISLVVPSGATLGTVSGQAGRLVLVAIDNAGTIELAIINLSGGVNLDETGLISTTAISAGSAAANVFYSTTARSNVPFRVVGFVDSTQATAGTWATAPTLVQGTGGESLASLSGLGFGQTPQSVTRTSGTTYYNTTGRPIALSASIVTNGSASGSASVSINGGAAIAICSGGNSSTGQVTAAGQIIIPAGASYTPTISNVSSAVFNELR